MIKLLWRTDVHLSDRTPSKRTGDWTSDVLKKLEWIGGLAEEINADAVLDGGDFFDVKSPKMNSHSLVRSTAEVHRKYPCPVWALVGNHDVKYGNLEYLPEQPLGVLFATGVFKPLGEYGDSRHELHITKDGLKVRVVGIPYHGEIYDIERVLGIKKCGEDVLIVAAHLLARAGNTGSMFEGEDILGYDLLEKNTEVDVWCFGHWHKDQGIHRLSNGAQVINVGSLTRGSLHLDDLDRKPCVVEISADREGVKCVRHDVPVRHVSEAFKVDVALYARSDRDRMMEIIDRMKRVATEDGSGIPLSERVKNSGLSRAVIEKTLGYLDETDQ